MARRWWRLTLVGLAAAVAAAAGTVLAVAVAIATGGSSVSFGPVGQHPLWWTAGATLAVAGAGLAVWWVQRWYERSLVSLIPAVQRLGSCVVERRSEAGQVVAALRHRGGRSVGIATAVHGAGGFGKTTLAAMVRAVPRLLRRFGGRVYWVTLGRDLLSAAFGGEG